MPLADWLPWARPRTTDLRDLNAPIATKPGVAQQEFGVSGTENFGGVIKKEDYNPELDDWQKAVLIYDKMRRMDPMIHAMLNVIKLPLRGATWTCHPASSDPVDTQIADFCNAALFEDDSMEDAWDFTLRHILLQLDFGFSVLEKVWKVDADGHYRFRRLAPRLPKTIREWHVNREGKLIAIVQYAAVPHGTPREQVSGGASTTTRYPTYGNTVSYQYLTIPADYAAVFTLDREGDNYEGWSVLRNVYRNWFFKDQAYHLMGVGLDRWGVGIPIVHLEEGHTLTAGDKVLLRELLKSVRSNEKSFLVMPEHTKFSIEPAGGGNGTQGSLGIQWIDHQDSQIARNVLAGFLTMGRDPRGTLGFGSRLTDMFISSLNGIAGGIAGDIKRQIVKPLCDFNYDMSKRLYPEPVCLDLEQVDLTAMVETMGKLTGTVITPQDEDEDILRKMMGLPKLNPDKGRGTGPSTPAPAGAPGGGGPPNPLSPGPGPMAAHGMDAGAVPEVASGAPTPSVPAVPGPHLPPLPKVP